MRSAEDKLLDIFRQFFDEELADHCTQVAARDESDPLPPFDL